MRNSTLRTFYILYGNELTLTENQTLKAYSHYSPIGKFELLGFCNATSLSYVPVKEATRLSSKRG